MPTAEVDAPDRTTLAQTGPELLRRLLLALATTLIVARPLVLGEDAGLSSNLADPWGMVLTLLWLLAAAGWAAWRYWLRPTVASGGFTPSARQAINWYGGIVQTALLMVVALIFVSAERASYKFPARLIAWEWFGLFVSFVVVRQLAVTPEEQHGLFAVVLAGAVALAVQGIYQEFVEMPSNRLLADDPKAFREKWAEENPGQDIDDRFLEQLRERARQNNLFGPYAHPNSYAGYLVLWIPGLLGAVVVCRRTGGPRRQMILTAMCAGLSLVVLWLTHSRGAMLGLATALVGTGLIVYRRRLRAHAFTAFVGLSLCVALVCGAWMGGLLTSGMGKPGNTIALRLEYWQTTWRMIGERPWFGVGPGNFGANYTRLMPPTAEEKIKDPHNFALEIAATSGVFAAIGLLTALGAFFYRVIAEFRTKNDTGERSCVSAPRESHGALTPLGSPEPIRWEFYLGGTFGLLLGFVLRVNTAAPSTILGETYSAALRSVAWFAAYALLERLVWSDRGRAMALTTGIVALLLNLCVSGGIGFPSVAGMLWVAIALALNAAALQPSPWLSRPGAATILPLPIFLGLFFGYGVYILYPVLVANDSTHEAVQTVAFFHQEAAKPASEQAIGVRDYPTRFVQKGVIEPLERAERLTPDDVRIPVQLAWWINVLWELSQRKSTQELPIPRRALVSSVRATQLDPHGAAGYWVHYQIRVRYAEILEARIEAVRKAKGDADILAEREKSVRAQYRLAAEALEKYLPDDPHDPTLHYALARAWLKAGDKEKGRKHAQEALTLDEAITAPTRKLADPQCEQLRKWFPDLSPG